MGKATLLVDVMGYPHTCDRCGIEQQWVWAVEARALGWDGIVEAIATDQELPVHIARTVLTAGGRPDVAALLGQRRERGRSFNPNICANCGQQECWHSFESVVVAGAHDRRPPIVSAPHPVSAHGVDAQLRMLVRRPMTSPPGDIKAWFTRKTAEQARHSQNWRELDRAELAIRFSGDRLDN